GGRVRGCSSVTSFAPPPMAIEPVVNVVATQMDQPAAVKKAAVEVLALFGAVSSAKAADLLVALIADADAEVRLQALKTVETARVAKAAPVLAKGLGDSRASVIDRRAIVKGVPGV